MEKSYLSTPFSPDHIQPAMLPPYVIAWLEA
jgi:hypothetical protein